MESTAATEAAAHKQHTPGMDIMTVEEAAGVEQEQAQITAMGEEAEQQRGLNFTSLRRPPPGVPLPPPLFAGNGQEVPVPSSPSSTRASSPTSLACSGTMAEIGLPPEAGVEHESCNRGGGARSPAGGDARC